jgi:hypothetical protein
MILFEMKYFYMRIHIKLVGPKKCDFTECFSTLAFTKTTLHCILIFRFLDRGILKKGSAP